MDGSMPNTGTLHDNASNHGRSVSRPEPATLEAGITDGTIPHDRTFHAGDPYRGWSMPNTGTFHDNALNHGQSDIQT